MSKRDLFADITSPPTTPGDPDWEHFKAYRQHNGLPPLLLLYPIDKVSEPDKSSKDREALNAAEDVLAIGVVFPGAHAGAQIYVSANLVPDDAVETPDGEDAIPDAVTDALQDGSAA